MAAWKTRDTHRIREQKLLMGNGRSSHEHKNQNMRQKPHAKPSIFAGRQVAAVTHSMHAVCHCRHLAAGKYRGFGMRFLSHVLIFVLM